MVNLVISQATPITANVIGTHHLTISGVKPGHPGVVIYREPLAGSIGGMLRFTGPGKVNLEWIEFWDGYAVGNGGGAVASSGGTEVNIDHCKFMGCIAGQSDGGAIKNLGTMTIKDTTFEDNRVTGNAAFAGGAIYSIGNLTLQRCTFTDNKNLSLGSGGAIANIPVQGSPAKLSITTCAFGGNVANNSGGGAIWNQGEIFVTSGIFTSNSAAYGGAIDSTYKSDVVGSMFDGNTAITDPGGAIRYANGAAGSAFTIHGSATALTIFRNNRAGKGGAIWLVGNPPPGGGLFSPSISWANFETNITSAAEGGAIYASVGNGKLLATNCVFDGNRCEDGNGQLAGQGGAVRFCLVNGPGRYRRV